MGGSAVELAILLTAKDAASGVLTGVAGKFQALGTTGKLVAAGVAVAATAVTTVIGTLTALASKSAAAAGEVSKLKRETGLTAEAASKFRVIGERMGLSVDDLSKSFGIFSKNVDNNAKAISENHVQVVKTKDGQVDLEKTLGVLADRFKNMPDGVAKTSLAMEIFGKSGKDMIPFLNQGKDGLKALGDEAERMGLVFDDKTIAAAKRLGLAQKDLNENIEGLKNRIGMAFLPVLADLSGVLLNIANAVLPVVTGWILNMTSAVGKGSGIFKDMVKAFQGDMAGGGAFLGGLIGPKAAADFMGLVTRIGETWRTTWDEKISPIIDWAKKNVPLFWEDFKQAVTKFWDVVEPKLKALIEKMETLKDKFDKLPPSLKEFATTTVVTGAVLHATGIDDIIMGWVSAIGQAASGIGALIVGGRSLAALGIAAAVAGAAFAAFALIIAGATVFIITHLDELDESWTMLSILFKLEAAKVADAVIGAWRAMLMFINKTIADLTLKLNEWILTLNKIPGVNIPLLSTIQIELPNANYVESTLNEIARNRSSTITIYTNTAPGGGGNARPQAAGGDYMVGPSYGGPQLFLAGEAGNERATFTPAGHAPREGGGTVINIYADVIDAQALDRFADKIGARWTQARRMQGLA